MSYFTGKKVLILGATGTLGKETVKQLLGYDVDSIRAYARHEESMFWLRQEFGDKKMRYLIGDIREKDRLNRAFENVDIVINCVALKHVAMCAENPFEAVKTNVIGTQNAIECAIDNNVEVFAHLSTDKAVDPINTYGYTKALAENLVLEVPRYQGDNRTKFCVFRSGNVKWSSGSCMEIWSKQYSNGQPLTVTDLGAIRYMASKENIVKTIINSLSNAQNGLYILAMKAYRVQDLVSGFPGSEVNIVGLREGEKLIEVMYRMDENFKILEVPNDRNQKCVNGNGLCEDFS